MQLTTARLCLNCEDVHDAQTCPMCASETFVYLTRWVPHSQRESRPAAPTAVAPAMQPVAHGGGAFSVIAMGLYQLFRRTQTRAEMLALRNAGELR